MGIFVNISGPGQNTVVGRKQLINGTLGAWNGSVSSVLIRFGVNGPQVNITPPVRRANGGLSWGFDGTIPNNIRPGQTFQVFVTATGTQIVQGGPEPVTEPVSGQATGTFVLENIVPQLTLAPFQAPVSTLAATQSRTFRGTFSQANPAVYGVPQVRFRVDGGPLTNAAVSGGNWTATVALPPGDHTFTVQASDPFDSVTTIQRATSVFRYPVAPSTDPAVHKTAAGLPTTSSVTSWTRLEPSTLNRDMGTSTSARVFDPLWLMTRQWQMGEFQAEDTGSPVQARVRATSASLSRSHLGAPVAGVAAGAPYDPARTPLEALVERRPMRPADALDQRMLTTAVDAGLHFLRMLDESAAGRKYRGAFRSVYALRAPSGGGLDGAAERFVQTMAGRAPDARRLATVFQSPGTPFDPELGVTPVDRAAVRAVGNAWLAWYDALFSEPADDASGDAWQPERLEYAVSVAARMSAAPADSLTLSAAEFDGGRLDWSSFDVSAVDRLDTAGDAATVAISESTIPAPVVVRGAPAPRFWEVEDARLAYGLMPVGPTDLAHLMMIEYASTYGNDWFVVPLEVAVGTVTRVDSLVVTDTFGVRTLLRPLGDPALDPPHFSLWQQADLRLPGERLGDARSATAAVGAPVRNAFFLPPTIGRSVDSAVLEDVLFMRDEMANTAWAIERSLEDPIERAAAQRDGAVPELEPPGPGGLPRYALSSHVPANWVPLLPVQLGVQPGGPVRTRLQRGAVLQPDGTGQVHEAASEAVAGNTAGLFYDEEIPREGVRVTRSRRVIRWTDGTTWLWTAFRKQVGSGEGSSALTFDRLEEPAG